MKSLSVTQQDLPLKVAGSSVYGVYPKISSERTYNMYLSDGWLIPYPGYQKILDQTFFDFPATPVVRFNALYKSPNNFISNTTGAEYERKYVIINNDIFFFAIDLSTGGWYQVKLTSPGNQLRNGLSGIVSIAENSSGTIIISYGQNSIGVITYTPGEYGSFSTTFLALNNTPFKLSYVSFQDGYFIGVDKTNNTWRLALADQLATWPTIGSYKGSPDTLQACVPLPGKSGQLFLMGYNHIESWVNVGASLFPYQKNTGYSINYGCTSISTLAFNADIVVWIGYNTQMNPVLMYSTGGEAITISTDGISSKLAQLRYISYSSAFLFKNNGHLFYQVTFYLDNITLAYDFTSGKFYDITDESNNYHIAAGMIGTTVAPDRDGNYLFVSNAPDNQNISRRGIYILGSEYTYYGYLFEDNPEFVIKYSIPRSRICNNIRFSDSSSFAINSITFPIEQVINTEDPIEDVISLSISRDGGQTYDDKSDTIVIKNGNSKAVFWNLGYANDFLAKLSFDSEFRIVATDGVVSIYK